MGGHTRCPRRYQDVCKARLLPALAPAPGRRLPSLRPGERTTVRGKGRRAATTTTPPAHSGRAEKQRPRGTEPGPGSLGARTGPRQRRPFNPSYGPSVRGGPRGAQSSPSAYTLTHGRRRRAHAPCLPPAGRPRASPRQRRRRTGLSRAAGWSGSRERAAACSIADKQHGDALLLLRPLSAPERQVEGSRRHA